MTSVTPPASNALDAQAIERLRELDPDGRHGVLARVLLAFESSLVKQLGLLAEAGPRGDAQALGAIAHLLKSSSQSVGALALAACCAETERRVRAGEAVDVAALAETLSLEASRALSAVRAMLPSP